VAPLPVTLIPKPYNCLYSLRQSRRLSGRVRRWTDEQLDRDEMVVQFTARGASGVEISGTWSPLRVAKPKPSLASGGSIWLQPHEVGHVSGPSWGCPGSAGRAPSLTFIVPCKSCASFLVAPTTRAVQRTFLERLSPAIYRSRRERKILSHYWP
jgi:hypothetical protein